VSPKVAVQQLALLLFTHTCDLFNYVVSSSKTT